MEGTETGRKSDEVISGVSPMEVRDNVVDLVNRAFYGKARIPIVRRGEVIAAIVGVEDFELLNSLQQKAS